MANPLLEFINQDPIIAKVIFHSSGTEPLRNLMADFARANPNYKFNAPDLEEVFNSIPSERQTPYIKSALFNAPFLISTDKVDQSVFAKVVSDPDESIVYPSSMRTYLKNHSSEFTPETRQTILDNLDKENAQNVFVIMVEPTDPIDRDPSFVKQGIQNLLKDSKDGTARLRANTAGHILDDLEEYNPTLHKEIVKSLPINDTFMSMGNTSIANAMKLADSDKLHQYIDRLNPMDREFVPRIANNPNFNADHFKKVTNTRDFLPTDFKDKAPHLVGKVPFSEVQGWSINARDSLAPKFLDFSNLEDESLKNFKDSFLPDSFGDYLENPTYRIQPDDIVHRIPIWMKRRSMGLPYIEGAKLTEKSKEYLKKYGNIIAEHPFNSTDKEEKLNELDNQYGSKLTEQSTESAIARKAIVHLSEFAPEIAAKIIENPHLQTYEPLAEFGHRDIYEPYGSLNPEVLEHMANPSRIEDAIRYNVFDEDHPVAQKPSIKDNFLKAYRGIVSKEKQSIPFLHRERFNPIVLYAMSGGLFDDLSEVSGDGHVMVKRGSAPLRYLRDHLEELKKQGVDSVDPKELPKDKSWNSILSTTRRTGKDGKVTETVAIDWNPLRDPKKGGKITAESVQKYIDSMAPKRYNLAKTVWSGAQRHNNSISNVLSIGMSDDHVNQLKEAGLWGKYKKAVKELPKGHPQHYGSLGWIRYTQDPHTFVDEVQTDVPGMLKGTDLFSDGEKDKVMKILFDGAHPSEVLHEAFHEYARKSGWVGKKVVIHSSKSKKHISLKDLDKPVPVHFKINYDNFPEKRLNAESSAYGSRPNEDHPSIQGAPVWETVFRKFEEPLKEDDYSDWD